MLKTIKEAKQIAKIHRYISDRIGIAEIAAWCQGDIIFIISPTGSGKSHFIKYILRAYLKERKQTCLYLLSRALTRQQFEKELPNDDVINFSTYQAIENQINPAQADENADSYNFIIGDECQYFTGDAAFNKCTDISFDWIMAQDKAIKIFMTATPDGIQKYFDEQGISYTNYHFINDFSHVQKLSFFWKEEQLETLAKNIIDSGDKGIFFIQSAGKAYELHLKFKDNSTFLCSKHNKKYSKFMDSDFIDELLENERFECILLFSTTALDAGTNIKDKALTNIVIDVSDPNTILQCIGRKRFIDENDNVSLYIHARSNKQLGGYIRKLNEQLDSVRSFENNGAIHYNAQNNRSNDSTGLIIDVPNATSDREQQFVKRINRLKYAQIRYDIETYQKMIELGKYGFVEYMSNLLGKKYDIIEDVQESHDLTQYLESIAGIPMLTPADRKELIEKLNIRQDGKLCRQYDTLSSWLRGSAFPYRLETCRKTKMIDGKKRNFKNTWVIVKV